MQNTQLKLAALLWLPCWLSACTAPEVLTPIHGAVPHGVDLSGAWQLRPESLKGQTSIREAINRTDGVDQRSIMRDIRGGQGSRGESGGLVHVFLRTGKLLKITQNAHALFISFDRAVVEEYRYGENRSVNIGAAQAHRVSGWLNGDYVIETLGENGMKLTDRYRVSDDGNRLIRRITLRSKDMDEVTIVHEFARQPD